MIVKCIATNCAETEATYLFKIKITNKASGVLWVDVDTSGATGTKFSLTVVCNPADIIAPSILPVKINTFLIGNGVPNITFPLFTTTSKACPILTYEIFDKNVATAVSNFFNPIIAAPNVTF